MRPRVKGIAAAVGVLLMGLTGAASAALITTVDWAADNSIDGAGTGTLAGGTVVSYTTVSAGNAGITVGVNWNNSAATDGAVMDGATHAQGGVLGTTTGTFLQTIAFSADVTNPILYVNFADATTTMDFGTQSLTLLDSNHAQLVGSVVSFSGAANGIGDGFAARINGTFGPGTPIQFGYSSQGSTAGFDSAAFTVGVAPNAVSEPTSLALLAVALTGLGFSRRRC